MTSLFVFLENSSFEKVNYLDKKLGSRVNCTNRFFSIVLNSIKTREATTTCIRNLFDPTDSVIRIWILL